MMKKLFFVFVLTFLFPCGVHAQGDEVDFTGWSFRAGTEKTSISYAFDGNSATCYESSTDPFEYPPHEIYIDTKKKTAVGGIRYTPPQDSDFSGTMGACEIYASNDGEDYYLIALYDMPASKSASTFYFDRSVEARYFKLATTATVSGSLRVAELRLLKPKNEMASLAAAAKYYEEKQTYEIHNPKMTAFSDSEQSREHNGAQLAVDDLVETMWHSRFSPVRDYLPISITIDLGRTENFSGISYLPRQDSYTNGRFQVCEISVSTDGENFTYVTTTDWAGDASKKYIEFPEVKARYVKINVLQATDGYAIAAEIDVLQTGVSRRASRAKYYQKYTFRADSAAYTKQEGETVLTGNTKKMPVIAEDTFMVTADSLEEVMGFETVFDAENYTLTVSKDGDTAVFSVDDDRFYFNQIRYTAPAAPFPENGVIYVPLKALAKVFGYQVLWNQKESEICIGNDLSFRWYDE